MSTDIRDFLRSLIGRAAHAPTPARDAVSASAIRTWCDAVGERHRIHLDPVHARAAGHADVVAPATMLPVWTMPGLEPDRPLTAGPARAGDLDETVRAELAAHGYSGTLAAATDQQFHAPVVAGDHLIAEDEYIRVSDEKRTRIGAGFFLTTRTTYRTAGGVVVGALTSTVFHFAPTPPGALADPFPAPEQLPPRPRPAESIAVEPGAECGPVIVPVTPTQIIAGALATRDFYPVHHDRDFARSLGSQDCLLNIMTTNGILARVVGEWIDHAELKSLTTRLVAPAYAHDELTVSGLVTARDDSVAELSVRAGLRDGVHAIAVARVRRR